MKHVLLPLANCFTTCLIVATVRFEAVSLENVTAAVPLILPTGEPEEIRLIVVTMKLSPTKIMGGGWDIMMIDWGMFVTLISAVWTLYRAVAFEIVGLRRLRGVDAVAKNWVWELEATHFKLVNSMLTVIVEVSRDAKFSIVWLQ